jgi:hypothetical protein
MAARLRVLAGQRAISPVIALVLILIVDGFISPGFFAIPGWSSLLPILFPASAPDGPASC